MSRPDATIWNGTDRVAAQNRQLIVADLKAETGLMFSGKSPCGCHWHFPSTNAPFGRFTIKSEGIPRQASDNASRIVPIGGGRDYVQHRIPCQEASSPQCPCCQSVSLPDKFPILGRSTLSAPIRDRCWGVPAKQLHDVGWA